MKRFAFLILVFAAATITEEASIKQEDNSLKPNTDVLETCLDETEITLAEIRNIDKQLEKIRQDDSIDDETTKSFDKYKHFIVCMLEKREMMKDSKLIVDKIMEDIEKSPFFKDKFNSDNKDILEKCLNALNDDNELTQEGRAIGSRFCILQIENENEKK